FFFSSRRRHTRFDCDWSSDVCSSDLRATRKSQVLIRKVNCSGDVLRRASDETVRPAGRRGAVLKEGEPGQRSRGRGGNVNVRAKIGRASCRERVWISVGGG